VTTLRRLLLREQVLPVVAALVLGAGFVWMELSRQSRVQAEARVAADLGHLERELGGSLEDLEHLGRMAADLWSGGALDPLDGEHCWRTLVPVARPLGARLAGLNLVRSDGRSFGLARTGNHLQGWTTDQKGGAWHYPRLFVEGGAGVPSIIQGIPTIDFRSRPWYAAAVSAQTAHWIEPFTFFGTQEGRPGLAWVVPVRDAQGTLQGAVAVHVLLDEVTESLRRIRPTPGATALAVDLQGRVMAAPVLAGTGPVAARRSAFLQPIGPERYPWAQSLLEAHRAGRPGAMEGLGRHHRYHGQGRRLERPGLAWFLVLAVPEEDLASDPRRRALVAGGVALMLGLLSSWQAFRLARKVAQPLGALGAAAEALGRAETPEVPVSSIREVQSLGRALEAAHAARLEREALHDQLRQAQKMETVGTLAGGIAHDVNNQLTAILGQVDLGLDHLDDAHPARRHLSRAGEAARRCAETTRALLAFSRPTTTEQKPTDLNAVVEETLHLLRKVVGARVQLDTDLAEGLPAVLGDPIQLEQVLVNLVVNARDALPAGGVVQIRTRPLESGVELQVQDNGIGMTPDVKARIFEPFFTTKGPGEGTGLGLAMVRGIVLAHGGDLTVDSAWGQGTTFRIRLNPAKGAARASAPERPERPLRLEGLRILVAEDEAGIRATVAEALEARGARVVEASSGEDAWFRIQEGGFDAVVTDHLMPGCTGLELLGRIRARDRHLPVILASGRGLEGLEAELAADPYLRFLPKPFSLARLLRTLDDLGACPSIGRGRAGSAGRAWEGRRRRP